MDFIVHTIENSFKDSIMLLPFLIVTYIIMEAVERAAGGKIATFLSKAGPKGPIIGALFGAFPQCGFSAAASNFYSAGLISMGTLIAVFMSTSDEMLPIFIAEQVGISTIVKVLISKIIIAAVSGFIVVFLGKSIFRSKKMEFEKHRKEHGHDCSEEGRGLIQEALLRSAKTFIYIFLITLVLDGIIHSVGEEFLESAFQSTPVIGELIAGAVGLIPNCAASIIITQLYLSGVISSGAMMSGLLVSAGVGVLVLFEENHNLKENIMIMGLLYGISVSWGIIIQALGIIF